jgi:hypothetical protein
MRRPWPALGCCARGGGGGEEEDSGDDDDDDDNDDSLLPTKLQVHCPIKLPKYQEYKSGMQEAICSTLKLLAERIPE